MAKRYWLMKSEPETYSWQDLVDEKRTPWDGVRNYQARNNLRDMSQGDEALFYHSGKAREVVGEMKVVKGPYQDPTTDDDRWVAVDVAPKDALPRPVALKEIKADDALSEILLVRNSRLSVMPLKREEYDRIVSMARDEASS